MSRILDWLSAHIRLSGLLLLSGLAGMLLLLDQAGLTERIEWPLRDAGMRWLRSEQTAPLANDVVVVAFDEAYLARAREPLALFHGHLAKALETLASLQPAVIGVDFALPEKSFRFLAASDGQALDYDRLLMIGLARTARTTPVILAATLDESARQYRSILPEYLSAAGLNPELSRLGLDPRGSVILCPDADGLIRRYPDLTCRGGPGALSPLAARMAAVQGVSADERTGAINYLAGPTLPILSVSELLARAATPEGMAQLQQQIRGRAVLVGAVLDYEDRHRIPVPLLASNLRSQQVPGILIQAQIYRSLMNQGLLTSHRLISVWPLLGLALLFWFGRRHGLKLGLLVMTGGALVLISLYAMQRGNLLPVTTLWCAAVAASLARGLLDQHQQRQRRDSLTHAFSGQVSPALLHYLEDHDQQRATSPRQAKVTLLGLQLDGALGGRPDSSEAEAGQRLQAISTWLTQVRTIASAHDGLAEAGEPGTMMLMFGQPLPLFAPERHALEAARELLALWHARRTSLGLGDIELRLAAHSGTALVGCLQDGGTARFTALGPMRLCITRLLQTASREGHSLVTSSELSAALGHPAMLTGHDPDVRIWQEEATHAGH